MRAFRASAAARTVGGCVNANGSIIVADNMERRFFSSVISEDWEMSISIAYL